jgi:Fe-S-cluster containining protein
VSSAGSTLCLACGMCCDGTLFSFVALSAAEATTLKAAGVDVRDEAGRPRLPQRCSALDGCKCTVYEQRPFVCRRFDCLLVRSLDEKELPLDEALGIVAEARARLERLDGLLPRRKDNEPSGAVLRAATLAQGGTRVSDEARHAFDQAQEHLRRHFVPD